MEVADSSFLRSYRCRRSEILGYSPQ